MAAAHAPNWANWASRGSCRSPCDHTHTATWRRISDDHTLGRSLIAGLQDEGAALGHKGPRGIDR